MWITRQPRPKIPMRKSDSKKSKLLKILEDYIIGHDKDITSILLHLWRDQMIVTGYKQIKDWVNRMDVTDEDLKDFKGDYQRLAEKQLKPIWERTMRDAVSPENPQFDWAKKFTRETENTQETPLGGFGTGSESIPAPRKPFFPTFNFEPQKEGVRSYIQQHTAELVTNATEEQKKAIKSVISYSTEKKFSTDEIARNIRKTIGLNSRQATANTKYYNRVKEQLTNDHPKMKPENIEKRARKQADIYAKEQLSYRAQMIARTEIGNAYNAGALYGVKEAIDQGLIASATKVWITSRNEANMCPGCAALEGTEIPIDDYFDYEGNQILSPLAHPNGKCTMEFHVEEPDFDMMQMDDSTDFFDFDTDDDFYDEENAESTNGNDWSGTAGVKIDKMTSKQLTQYINSRGFKTGNISKFDGDPELLKAQVNTLSSMKKKYGNLMKDNIKVSVADLDDDDFAQTLNGDHVVYNTKALRSKAITEKNIQSQPGWFSFDDFEGISRHESGHLIEAVIGKKGFALAKEAYYNTYKEDISDEDLTQWLYDNISFYSTDYNGDERVDRMRGKFSTRKYSEVISEIIASSQQTDYTKEFERMLMEDHYDKT